MQCIYSQAKLLQRIPLFAGLDASKLQGLAFTSDHLRYETGEHLYRVGQPVDAVHVLLKGRAHTLHGDDERVVAEILPGEVVGAVPVLAESKAPCDVIAMEPTEALVIPRDIFLDLLTDNPGSAMALLRGMARNYVRTSTHMSGLGTTGPRLTEPV
jgi:CRP-like cAMP-binding protein